MEELDIKSRKGKLKRQQDISTVDKVLDHLAMGVINKLQARSVLRNLGGAFSSGKESNVYVAECSTELSSKFIQPENTEPQPEMEMVPVVLKIYKTSTMTFKDRERYVVSEKRFTSYPTGNSRKLVKIWAEKEVRNLKRLAKHGIPVPRPMYLKKSVLIMTMIGDCSPAPRLKDVTDADWNSVYFESLDLLRRLYQDAGLVHADFSEYNLIYHNNQLYVIDVAQSVERDHENSNNFLAMDICNCNEFFKKKGVDVKNGNDVFEEITGLNIPEYLKKGTIGRDAFIPTRLSEVVNKEDYELFVESNQRDRTATKSKTVCKNSLEQESEINIYVRKLKVTEKQPTKEEQKEYQKKRKAVVKEMNRERRVARAERNSMSEKTRKKLAERKKKEKRTKASEE